MRSWNLQLRTWYLCGIFCSFLFSANANADRISPYLAGSANGLITVDKKTQLQWLDLKATQGLSVEQVLAGEGGWIKRGFRYATFDEVKELLTDAGLTGAEGYLSPTGGDMRGSASVGVNLLRLIGTTSGPMTDPSPYTKGYIAPRPCLNHSNVCDAHLVGTEWTYPNSYAWIVGLQIRIRGPEQTRYQVVTMDPTGPTVVYRGWSDVGSWLVRDHHDHDNDFLDDPAPNQNEPD